MKDISECKNCGNKLKDKFCPHCGQSSHTEDINFGFLVHELQHSLLHIDKGILYTARELFKRPGHTIREYIEGKRVKHFKPIAYVFLLSTFFSLLVKVSKQTNFLDDFLVGFSSGSSDDSNNLSLRVFVVWINWLKDHYAISMLLLIPIFSLATYFCFKRSGYNYIQFLILNAFIYGQATVLYFGIHIFQYFFKTTGYSDSIDTAKPIVAFFYTLWAYRQFFHNKSSIKTLLLTVLSHILYVFILFILMVAAMLISKSFV